MRIESAEYSAGILTLKVRPDESLFRFLRGFKEGNYKIEKEKPKRTNAANKYLWSLCGEIGKRVGMNAEAIYRQAVKDYGYSEVITIPSKAVDKFKTAWANNGIAWFSEELDRKGDLTEMIIYYGSSTYDTSEFSKLVDGIIQEAKMLDIEVLSEREISLLKER